MVQYITIQDVVQLIAAVGSIITSCLAMYLVHRRIMADRETRAHRSDEDCVHQALVEKLQLKITKMEEDKKAGR